MQPQNNSKTTGSTIWDLARDYPKAFMIATFLLILSIFTLLLLGWVKISFPFMQDHGIIIEPSNDYYTASNQKDICIQRIELLQNEIDSILINYCIKDLDEKRSILTDAEISVINKKIFDLTIIKLNEIEREKVKCPTFDSLKINDFRKEIVRIVNSK